MKIGIYSIPELTPGKHNVKDARLDKVDSITKSRKKTYVQVELTSGEDALLNADAILAYTDARADLILKDLEFVETRLSRVENEAEKILLNRLKELLEKENFIFNAGFNDEEKRLVSGYGLLTNKPVIAVEKNELSEQSAVFARALGESGFISFFTTGEKETRAWLIKKGATAWEASGAIHSDIQKGFIRAEIISFDDFINSGSETAAKQAGKLRLEQKDYLMQDADLVNFRFSK